MPYGLDDYEDERIKNRKAQNRKKTNSRSKSVSKPRPVSKKTMPSGSKSKTDNNRRTSANSKKRKGQSSRKRNNEENVKDLKTSNYKQVRGDKKGKKKKKRGKHPKLMLTLKIMLVLFLLLCVVGAGIVAAMFFGLFGDQFEITKEELKIGAANSVIVDVNGAQIESLNGDEKRKVITLEEMSEYLPKAYVSIEDERFYQHSGVDLKRTAGAIVGQVLGKSSYGGSTITQQLVKNITKDDERSGIEGILRKVKEWAKAYQVERMITKDQILELYLNIIFVGSSNLHGVELGAEYYFNKTAKDLDLAESAFLAGINNSPNSYDPFDESKDHTELIKKRTLTVLSKMKELGNITNEDEYNAAVEKVEAGLPFQKGTTSTGVVYSYHTDALIDQIVTQLMNEKDMSREMAESYLYGSGLTIYSTVDTNIQSTLQDEYAKSKYIASGKDKNKDGSLVNDHTQSGMAVVDYKTGNVLGVAGGLGEKTESRGLNRATQMFKQTGSSIKPIADIAPGLEEKVITAATIYDDAETDFSGYTPKNDHNRFRGLINIRSFIATSQNIPAVKIMRELTPTKSIEYLRKMGLTKLVTASENKVDNDESLPLAIGGLTTGASPLEMASAYGTIANGGVYITPTFYTKVVDSNGNTVLEPKQEHTRVISEANAYIATSITQEPVTNASGTATYCAIPGIDTAAKTGTTDNDNDRWLCGFTPYYAAATWFGYDNKEEVKGFSVNPAGQIWDAVMTQIHSSLANATFTRPTDVIEATVCKTTGCLASSGCSSYTEIFTSDNLPEKCEGHGSQTLCTESGLIANEYCPSTKANYYGASVPKEQLDLWKPINGKSSSGTKVTGTCTIHTKPAVVEKPVENKPANTNANTNTNTTVEPTPKPEANTTTNTGTEGNTTTE